MKTGYIAVVLLFASLPLVFLFTAPVNAATIHRGSAPNQLPALPATIRGVTNTADSGVGSLRDVLTVASPGDTIIFTLTLPNTITLTSGRLEIYQDQTISGPITPSLLTIDGNNSSQVFYILSGEVSISGLTIRNGYTANEGGGIYNNGGLTLLNSIVISNAGVLNAGGISNVVGKRLVLDNVAVISNTSGSEGGGLRNSGTVMISNSTFMSNTALLGGGISSYGPATLMSVTVRGNSTGFGGGGGVYAGAPMTITNSSIISNITSGWGGGINMGAAPVTISNSAILSNTTTGSDGGGIFNSSGSLWMTNATLSGNVANSHGGGLINYSTGINFLTNVTVYTNTANFGGGISLNLGSATLTNTIVADNGGGNCDGSSLTSNGYNLDSANTCSFASTGDLINTNPHLAPLANNGGATLTHALRPGSIAIDHGTNTGCPSTDQRGGARPRTAANPCDIGAYEAEYLFLPLIMK